MQTRFKWNNSSSNWKRSSSRSRTAMPSFCCPDCGTEIQGTNCAHSLSRQMVKNMFFLILEVGGCILNTYSSEYEIQGWRNISGCYAACPCGYPVRAKELRANLFTEVKSFLSLCFGLICILVPVVETFLFYSGWQGQGCNLQCVHLLWE